jgi:hypothetical protein
VADIEPAPERISPVAPADGWVATASAGGGPFTSHVTWRLPEGREAVWESRIARKRGAITLRDRSGRAELARATAATARRLTRLNLVAATAFTVGGLLFVAGASVAQLGSGDPATCASIYFAGGIFFSTGGYASLLQAINAPRQVGPDGTLESGSWRWWSYEPERIDWLSAFVLFVGTLAFGISLIDSFLEGLTTHQENRLIWAPEMMGCLLFLISGHLAWTEVCHRARPCWRKRDLAWSIVAVNQLGSVLFFVAGLAGFIRPATSSAAYVAIANWGTLLGAFCFAVGGVLQAFERPAKHTSADGV